MRPLTKWTLLAILGIAVACALSGCEYLAAADAGGKVVTSETIRYKRDYNDAQRETVTAAVCETTIGAQYRDPNQQHQMARTCLCGGPCDGKVDISALLRQLGSPASPGATVAP